MKDVEDGIQQIQQSGNPWRDEVQEVVENPTESGENVENTIEFPEGYVNNDAGNIREGWPENGD